MRIRRKKFSRERPASTTTPDLFHNIDGRSAIVDAVSTAATDLRQALAKACATIAEAEEAMAKGSRPFQEAMESCKAASSAACDAAVNSAAAGELQAKRTIDVVMQNLQRISTDLSKAVPSKNASQAAPV